jgi:hypothetical protein
MASFLDRRLATKSYQRQVAREQRAEQRVAHDFESYAKRHRVKIKRQGHGRAKQMRELRPQIVLEKRTTRARRAIARATQIETANRKALADRLAAHAARLDAAYKGQKKFIENPGDLFQSLPIDLQIQILGENTERETAYAEGAGKPLGRPFDPLFAYHQELTFDAFGLPVS